MDKLTGMAVFARVVEAHSFTTAAAQLGMSRSAVSKAIAGLEDRLGARLLNRTTRRLALTEVGQAFYERCARIVAEAEDAEFAVSRLQATPRGILRLSAPVSFGILHLAPALPDFMQRYPKLRVEIDLADRTVDLIEEGYDLAVRIGALPDSSLIARRLADNHMVVCAAPAYWQRRGRPEEPRDLVGHACITYAYQRSPNEWPFVGPGGRFSVRVDGPLLSNNGDLALTMALAGLGIVVLPCFFCGSHLAAGRLEPVLRDWMPPPSGIHAVYPHGAPLVGQGPRLRRFSGRVLRPAAGLGGRAPERVGAPVLITGAPAVLTRRPDGARPDAAHRRHRRAGPGPRLLRRGRPGTPSRRPRR